ncbi:MULTISPECIES: hypothetical protein [unclassified Alkalihalobacillus]|uniref:hypothetical protein n=1 Tax=unclassified Alkalihalobacillus TaxID=2675276 RepID=UPI0022DDFB59|nr:hypothetical protein [Alkalihalobacillus sp. CinArs1]
MSKRTKDRIISALAYAVTAILFGYFIYGEIKWPIVLGLTIGGFVLPVTGKLERKDKS